MTFRSGWVFGLLATLGVSGCASIASPDGGPRDTTPPKLVSTLPANGARNVTSRTIRLEFSEDVQLKELTKNLIVAPLIPDDNRYKLREDRNAISLTYEKPLAPNTTYSFNFGDAIVDITESNKAKNARLAFSTGPQLDSGSVRGLVTTLLTAQPVENASVLLYPEGDTAGVQRGRPYYLARTDKAGAFSLENLKDGPYRLYALLDKNQNNHYDDGERIAYQSQALQVRAGLDSVRLQLVHPDGRKPILTSQQPEYQQFKVSYNEGIQRARLAPLAATTVRPDTALLNQGLLIGEQGKAVLVFKTPTLAEGRYLLTATDSAGNAARDTVNVRFQGKEPTRRSAGYAFEGSPREVYRKGQLKVRFAVPVTLTPGQSFASLVEDSTNTRRALSLPQSGRLNASRTELTINLDTKAEKSVTIQLDSTTIRAVTGQSLGFRPLKLAVSEQSPTGTISGPIKTTYKSYQIQVVDDKFQPIAVLNSPVGTYLFNHLPPGTYRLRVLIDANNDGIWFGGDPALQRPAEPVYIGPVLQPVRADWEQVIPLTF